MTEALTRSDFTCSEGACEVALGGACLDGFPSPAGCPHATATGSSEDALDYALDSGLGDDSPLDVVGAEEPDKREERESPRTSVPVVVPGEEALTLAEAGDLMAKHRVTMVLIAGEAEVGKTTLVTELFARFLLGPFNKWLFGGSETLRAFHIRLFPSLAESGAGTPTTERTADEDMRFLHLCLSRDGIRHQILASDGKGEYFENLIEHGDVATEVPIAARADRCVVTVDGRRLNDPRLRDSTISRARLLLRALTGPDGVPATCRIAILCTKWDEVGQDNRDTVLSRLNQLASSHRREVVVITATVRPGPPKVDVDGLEELLDFVAPSAPSAPSRASRAQFQEDDPIHGRYFWRARTSTKRGRHE